MKVYHRLTLVEQCCFVFDHEKGVLALAIVMLVLTVASFVVYVFGFSIHILYWQVLFLVANVGLIAGVRKRKAEYFLPWLMIVSLFVIVGPFVSVIFYFHEKNLDDELIGIIVMAIVLPTSLVGVYLFIVVMSLFSKISDPKSSVYKRQNEGNNTGSQERNETLTMAYMRV